LILLISKPDTNEAFFQLPVLAILREKHGGVEMIIKTRAGTAPETEVAHAEVAPLRVENVALTVRDIGRTETFYRAVLGLRVLQRSAGSVDLGAGDRPLVRLLHRPQAMPDNPTEAGLYHTAFLLPSAADLAAWLLHLESLRHPLQGAAEHVVSQSVYLADPEGNGVEVYADAPRKTWVWDGPLVKFATLPLDRPALLAKARTRWDGAPGGTTVGHVHLRVGDVAAAEQFYRDAVGFTTVARRPGAVFMSTGRYHHHIALNTWQSAGAGTRDQHRAGLAAVTLAFAGGGPSQALEDPWGTQLHIRPSATAGEPVRVAGSSE
jgi:catechol 2,3-dioxygenase